MPRSGQVAHVFRGSTRVDRAWYDSDSRKVTVQFPDGIRWAYYGVPLVEWQEFIEAPSAGRFLRKVLERHQHGPTGR